MSNTPLWRCRPYCSVSSSKLHESRPAVASSTAAVTLRQLAMLVVAKAVEEDPGLLFASEFNQ